MVARTPPKQHRNMVVVASHLSPTLLRETVKKVDKCMARLQELQYTVRGGTKVMTSLRCKQESMRMKSSTSRRSPPGKLPPVVSAEDWRRMSLPAMLLGETMGEILDASQFARNIVEAAAVSSNNRKPATDFDDPKTPVTEKRKQESNMETGGGLQARRKREKQVVRSESDMMPPPSLQRAKSRINFINVSSSPLQNRGECNKENCRYIANRVSPRNRPWVRKTVLFPNPLFHSSSPTYNAHHHQKSPVIARNPHTPHKFLVKSPPPPAASKFQVKIKSPPISISPTRASSAAAKLRRSFSPSRLANRLVSPLKTRKSVHKKNNEASDIERNRQTARKFLVKSSPPRASKFQGKIKSSPPPLLATTSLGKKSSPPPKAFAAAKLRRSFSPSRLANRLVSPLKTTSFKHKNEGLEVMSTRLNQRPTSSSTRFSPPRI